MLRHLFGGNGGGHRPYRNDAANGLYNLLFCDEPARFAPQGRRTAGRPGYGAGRAARPRGAGVHRRRPGHGEPRSHAGLQSPSRDEGRGAAKQLLGVILEVPQGRGLDTLAVFADGRIRYINQAEKIGIFEDVPPAIAQKAQMVLRASQAVVDQIGPANEPRRAPPTGDLTRMTFLVSDGLYFGEAATDDMYADKLGGPRHGQRRRVVEPAGELRAAAAGEVVGEKAEAARLERAKGIEPSYAAWEAAVLPLNYARERRLTQRTLSELSAICKSSGEAALARQPNLRSAALWHREGQPLTEDR